MKLNLSAILITTVSLVALHSYGQKKINFPAFSAEAHRGGRGLVPENTIMAMANTLKIKGITTLEMDTHVTKDGQVVVTHDDYLSPAFMLMSDGKEIPEADAKRYPVFGMDYAELKQFDLGTKYYAAFPTQRKVKRYIPLLANLIDSVQQDIKKNKRQQVFYNIETKCSPLGDGVTNPTPEVFVKLLMEVIEKKKIVPFVVIQSFDKRTIQLIKKNYPGIKTSFLVANKKSYDENIADLGYKPFILSPVWQMVNTELVSKAHADGVKVIPWTANKLEDIQKLKALKVDGIISDYPDILVQAK